MPGKVTCICKDCNSHFVMTRADKLYAVFRKERRKTHKMPMHYCPRCWEKTLVRRDAQFRTGKINSQLAFDNAMAPANFHRKCRVRSWAWRELDD